jgi:5-methylcytosine-specific restriction endonuclease McrA
VGRDYYGEYLSSDRWREKRIEALKAAGYKCSRCGTHGARGGSGLQVHHRTYERLGEELPDDLQVLCRRCHQAAHGKPPTRRQRQRIRAANAEADWLRAGRAQDAQTKAALVEENDRLRRLQSAARSA